MRLEIDGYDMRSHFKLVMYVNSSGNAELTRALIDPTDENIEFLSAIVRRLRALKRVEVDETRER